MVDATKACESSYVNADLVRDSPTKKAVIIDEGGYVEGTYEGKAYEKLEVEVEIDGKRKKWSPNKDSCKNLVQEYGRDTKKWVGMVIKLSVSKVNGKDSVIGFPISKPAVVQEENI